MKAIYAFGLMILAVSMTVTGCATTDSYVPAGTGLGAGAGALLGYGLTGSGLGAAAGAGAGALAGAITGTVLDERKAERETARRAYGHRAVYREPQAPARSYATQADPTRGSILNHTRWRLEVIIDSSESPMFLAPRQNQPVNLDIGEHQVLASAYVQTQFGERKVGTVNRTLYIDPKGSGWSLRFDETMF